jgi:hypothetical protein
VLNLGDGSTLVVDETVYDTSKGAGSTLLHLLGGKVRALVSDYYSGGQASYRIETTTAVSGVRGTEFVVAYDTGSQLSQVLGLGGAVAVNSPLDRKGHGVVVHAMELTDVAKGKYPTPPRLISVDDDRYRQLMAGLDLPGSGIPESLLPGDPSFGGKDVPQPDTADSNLPPPSTGGAGAGGEPTGGTPPGQPTGGTNAGAPWSGELPPFEPGKTGGDLLDQPQPVLDAPTDIDVHF